MFEYMTLQKRVKIDQILQNQENFVPVQHYQTTQNLSKNTGRHTTTTTRLYDGPSFSLIDTPGAGDIDLENFNRLQITSGFHEIFSATKSCKFTNCSHASNEQGCNVLNMLNKGIIAKSRYENFMQEVNGRK